jgi:hypothetical protein
VVGCFACFGVVDEEGVMQLLDHVEVELGENPHDLLLVVLIFMESVMKKDVMAQLKHVAHFGATTPC